MLFNSEIFIYLFLPVILGIAYLLKRWCSPKIVTLWLVFASAVFYGSARVDYLLLLISLILFNFVLGEKLLNYPFKKGKVLALWFGISINLGVLFYYKYSNFMLSNLNAIWGTHYLLENIILPIGISFFIFQKIAYIVDSYHGKRDKTTLLDFSLFVMFFPQLIAGPIVYHNELMSQFKSPRMLSFNLNDVTGGILLFTIGLCKKIFIADQLSTWVDKSFGAANNGIALNFLESLGAALGFTFQIYFDFSAYTDMAIGIALMMGIQLPFNFNSPYKSENIIQYRRNWHITLSRFLRDYVYIPLGGNRTGNLRRYGNILLTMLIGGFWHGAAWTFVLWGFIHGVLLIINHAWVSLKDRIQLKPILPKIISSQISRLFTFSLVVLAMVIFRSQNLDCATTIFQGLLGQNGFLFETNKLEYYFGHYQSLMLLLCLLIVWVFPNSQEIHQKWLSAMNPSNESAINQESFIPEKTQIKKGVISDAILYPLAGAMMGLLVFSVILMESFRDDSLKNFIYFQF